MFGCAGCGAVLTAPVSQVALPVHARQTYGHELLPALMEPGTYAVDPEPWGPPWRLWTEVGADEAAARGVYAPVYSLPYGPAGAVVIAPGDVRGTVLIAERCDGDCMGVDGRAGSNLACAECGRAVATRVDDCSLWQAVWLDPRAVRLLAGGGIERRVWGWEELRREVPGTPPVEPRGWWSPVWEAAVGVTLAHLLVVSGGSRMGVPDGLVADVFGRALDALLPPGPPVREMALAGPDLPATTADIAVVPRHPQTDEVWPFGAGGAAGVGAGAAVPLAADVWAYLAFHYERRPVPGPGGMPADAHRDDPPPLLPRELFRPDGKLFLRTLARLPEVRAPWLRAIYDRVADRPYGHPF